MIVGNDPDNVKTRDEVKNAEKYCFNGHYEDIPIQKVAAIAAGLACNERITEFEFYSKRIK